LSGKLKACAKTDCRMSANFENIPANWFVPIKMLSLRTIFEYI